jgi:tetratricopeptide (TPR) repeat protein/TolB-like protein
VTAACNNRRMARLLHAYELGMLSEPERIEVEAHLIECDTCAAELSAMTRSIGFLRYSPTARQQVREAAREAVDDPVRLRPIPRMPWRVAVPVAVTVVLTLLLILKDWQVEIKPSAPAMASGNCVAILPFANLVCENDTTHLGEVIGNLLVTGLSESPSLQVVSSQFVFDLTTRADPIHRQPPGEGGIEVARKAGARYLVTGAITRSQPQLAVSTQIVDVPSGLVRAAFRDTATTGENIFASVDRLALRIRRTILQETVVSNEAVRPVAEITTSSPEAYQEYIQGCELMRMAYVDDAAPRFRRALQYDSTFAMAYYYLASLTGGAERRALIAQSVKYVDRAGERDRFFIRSRAAMAAGNTEQGLLILKDFVKRYPDEKEPLLSLGRVQYGLRQFDAARDCLTSAIRLDSAYADAFNLLAYVYDRLGNVVDAFRAADRYVALRPNEANPYDSRAEIYARNGDLDQAIASYRRALEIKPDLYGSISYLGIMYAFKGDYARAESCFVTLSVCPIADAREASSLYLAYLPACRGRFDSSLILMAKAIAADSSEQPRAGQAFAYNYEAVLYEALGRTSDALTCQRKSVQVGLDSDPGDANRRWAYLVHLLASTGHLADATREAEKLKYQLDSLHAPLNSYYCAKGSIALAQTRPDSALFWLEQAAQSFGFYDSYLLSQAYVRSHRPAEAIKLLTKLAACYTSPRMYWTTWSVQIHYWLGLAYEESRWYTEAKQEYRTFLDTWSNAGMVTPEMRDARERLERLEGNRN